MGRGVSGWGGKNQDEQIWEGVGLAMASLHELPGLVPAK